MSDSTLMVYILLDSILHNTITTFFFCDALHLKKGGILNKCWKVTAFLSLLTLTLGSVALSILPYSLSRLSSALYLSINIIVLFGIAAFYFSDHFPTKAATVLILSIIDVLAFVLSRHLLTVFFSAETIPLTSTNILSIISIPFQAMIYLTLCILMISCRKITVHKLVHKELLIYILLPLYQLLLFCISISTYEQPDEAAFIMGNFILCLNIIVDFIMIFSIDSLIEKIEIEDNLAALYVQRQAELDYYQLVEKHMEAMKAMKLEFASHLQAIRSSLQNTDTIDDIPELIKASRHCLDKNALPRYCEHEIVNAVLTIKKQVASEKFIPMDINVRVPNKLSIAEIDLCSLFCNLLDNAIEACEKMKNQNQFINIKANVSGGFLIVKTENTYETPVYIEHGIFKTSKDDPDEHGYGIKLVERITKKYDGQLTIEHSDNIFTASAALLLPSVDKIV